jgi:hypothetical protein
VTLATVAPAPTVIRPTVVVPAPVPAAALVAAPVMVVPSAETSAPLPAPSKRTGRDGATAKAVARIGKAKLAEREALAAADPFENHRRGKHPSAKTARSSDSIDPFAPPKRARSDTGFDPFGP